MLSLSSDQRRLESSLDKQYSAGNSFHCILNHRAELIQLASQSNRKRNNSWGRKSINAVRSKCQCRSSSGCQSQWNSGQSSNHHSNPQMLSEWCKSLINQFGTTWPQKNSMCSFPHFTRFFYIMNTKQTDTKYLQNSYNDRQFNGTQHTNLDPFCLLDQTFSLYPTNLNARKV